MIRSVTARVSGGSVLRSIRDRRIRYDSASMGCTSVMLAPFAYGAPLGVAFPRRSSVAPRSRRRRAPPAHSWVHLYRVRRTNFDALAALRAKLLDHDQGIPVRPERVLGAGQQARAAAAAVTGNDHAHGPAHR